MTSVITAHPVGVTAPTRVLRGCERTACARLGETIVGVSVRIPSIVVSGVSLRADGRRGHRRQGTLDDKEIASIQSELDNAAKVQDEVVIAAVYPLETLLRATRNQ